MTTWKLKPGADRRIRAQHPWVFSNELAQSPKGHTAGMPVRLVDTKGQFVASGYGNPNSLIAFRALSFDSKIDNPCSMDEIVSQVVSSWGHRSVLGYSLSFRLIYGEGDFLPGLVIDRYVVEADGKRIQVFACQILAAGIHESIALSDQILMRFFNRVVEETEIAKLNDFTWEKTAVVMRNDVQVRRLEGMEVEEPRVLKEVSGFDLRQADILIPAVYGGGDPIKMRCDLIDGQKTGFFLDQVHNISLLCKQVALSSGWEKPVRILDLCCYVGHWSAQLARTFKAMGIPVETTVVDVSEPALAFAKLNAEREGAQVFVQKLNVLEQLAALPEKHFDIVIADPPAFIKAKKDVPTGRHAYLKMNTSAFRLAVRGGWVVSCSCSGLLNEEDLMDVVAKSLRRLELQGRCLVRGGHSADHPNLMAFPEGFYLKMFLHQIKFN